VKLIPNWRTAWRFGSMWCFAMICALCTAWLALAWLSEYPYMVGPGGIAAILALSVLGAVLRIVAQPHLAEDAREFLRDLGGDDA